ncbi:hypothetical protein N665_0082s0015 [Sinapis alba]|nr:hypothetical protein N665_0082s0015 [Sinapis alba]
MRFLHRRRQNALLVVSVTTDFVSVTSTLIGFISGILQANSCSSLFSATNLKLISPLSHPPSIESYSNLLQILAVKSVSL